MGSGVKSMVVDPVVIFDGDCILCSSSIRFFVRNDDARVLKFTSRQSSTGTQLLRSFHINPEEVDSIAFVQDGKVYLRSTAVLKILAVLRAPVRWGSVLLLVPTSIRDFFYTVIARNRYRWFGKHVTCEWYPVQDRSRFLN